MGGIPNDRAGTHLIRSDGPDIVRRDQHDGDARFPQYDGLVCRTGPVAVCVVGLPVRLCCSRIGFPPSSHLSGGKHYPIQPAYPRDLSGKSIGPPFSGFLSGFGGNHPAGIRGICQRDLPTANTDDSDCREHDAGVRLCRERRGGSDCPCNPGVAPGGSVDFLGHFVLDSSVLGCATFVSHPGKGDRSFPERGDGARHLVQ